ncbi:MAG: peptidoglycan bridge formation glycyltransferase FemA/FemB family protein [Candidatus Dormiibacterota bacterium]
MSSALSQTRTTPTGWDDSLPESAHLLQSYRWGELQSRFGWDVERTTINVGGDEVPVSLLTAATSTPGGRHAYVPRGPAIPRPQMAEAMAALARLAEDQGLAYIRVEPDIEAPYDPPEGWRPGATTQPEHTSIIDLRPGADELLAGFKPKTRYNIRLAMKKGVRVERSDDVGAFAEMAQVTSSRHRIQLAEEPYYRAVLELLGPADMARLYIAYQEATPLAGIVVTRFRGRAIYLFGASARTGRQLMPAYLLHWQAIQDLKATGDVEYDLWGIPPDESPDHPWAGLWQFKSGWNGRRVVYASAYTYVSNVTMWRADLAVAKIKGNVRRVRSKLRR